MESFIEKEKKDRSVTGERHNTTEDEKREKRKETAAAGLCARAIRKGGEALWRGEREKNPWGLATSEKGQEPQPILSKKKRNALARVKLARKGKKKKKASACPAAGAGEKKRARAFRLISSQERQGGKREGYLSGIEGKKPLPVFVKAGKPGKSFSLSYREGGGGGGGNHSLYNHLFPRNRTYEEKREEIGRSFLNTHLRRGGEGKGKEFPCL